MILESLLHHNSHEIITLGVTGLIVGFFLALTGGGGSVICVPLLLYLVRMDDAHVVIGTSALAVAVSALINLFTHAMSNNVYWAKGFKISLVSIAGSLIGAEIGKQVSSQYILIPFSLLMVFVAILMWNKNDNPRTTDVAPATRYGAFCSYLSILVVGILAGFLGIGGGFLVVPVLIWLFRFQPIKAIATSLMVVFAMGLTTSMSYAVAGKIIFSSALMIILGGIMGGAIGVFAANGLQKKEYGITKPFSLMLACMALYMLIKNS